MGHALTQWKTLLHDRTYLFQLIISLVFFTACMMVVSLANGYATTHLGPSVPDIFISNVPAVNVLVLYIYSAAVFAFFVLVLALWRPTIIPFVAFALGMFYLTRSGFVILTNVGLPVGMVDSEHISPFIKKYFFGGDLFFSGHAGAPFLIALAFWNHHKALRTIFLIISVVSAAVVLAGHYHYSIDVAAAYFITYGIYKITKHWFPSAFEYFNRASF